MVAPEAWKLTKPEAKKLDAFQQGHPTRIFDEISVRESLLPLRWIQGITGVNRVSDEIRHRRWSWIGHIMRKNWEEHCVRSLEWRPEGRRPGQAKTRKESGRRRKMSSWVANVDDCQSFSSKPKWMKRQCQRLMCLSTKRYWDRGTTT